MPIVTGLKLRHVAFVGQEHALLAARSTIALAGTTSVFSLCSTMKSTFAYMPGFSRKFAFWISTSICAVRVAGSRTGATCAMRPSNFSPGKRIDRDVGLHARRDPPQILLDDVGDEPHDADVDDRNERRVRRDPGAGIERALADEAADRRGDDGVRQIDLQLVEPRLRLRVLRLARSSCAAAA